MNFFEEQKQNQKNHLFFSSQTVPWLVIEFSELGFIGKLFKTTDLPLVAQFFTMFFQDKPCDWLLYDIIDTKVCRYDKGGERNCPGFHALWQQHKPSLFQHIGRYSSLKGKRQGLMDTHFDRVETLKVLMGWPRRRREKVKEFKG